MELKEQRALGIKLANSHDAKKTAELINDPTSSIEQILTMAASEIGVDKLVETILDTNPSWAHFTLMCVPNLGEHAKSLLIEADKLHEHKDQNGQHSAAKNTAFAVAKDGTASELTLSLISGAAFAAYFTMYWQNPSVPGVTQPRAGTQNSGAWVWARYEYDKPHKIGKCLSAGPAFGSATAPCSVFALQDSPLEEGATVWLVMEAIGRNWIETPYRFTYSPSGGRRKIETWGGIADPQFKLTN